jgi:replicative DNA helicase
MLEEYKYDDGFQLRLLACLVRHPEKMDGLIEPNYFQNPCHQDIAKLSKLIRQGDAKDSILSKTTLLQMVKAFLGRRAVDLWPIYRRAIKQIYAERLRDLPVLVNEAAGFQKFCKYGEFLEQATKDRLDRKYEAIDRRFAALKTVGATEDLGIRLRDDVNASRWEEDRAGIVPTFCMKLLDVSMGGGIGQGELAIIEGGGKSGKSLMLANIAAGAIWQNKNVAIASGELGDRKYRKRIDALLTAIDYHSLFKKRRMLVGGKRVKEDIGALAKLRWVFKHAKGDIAIKQFPSGKAKIRDIEIWLNRLEDSGFPVDLLVVDYAGLFLPNERYEERRLNIGQVAVDLRGLAIERKLPVWTAAQVNRSGLNKPMIGPTDLAEDISQFWTLDFLIGICQTEKERGSQEDRRRGVPEKARIVLASARDVASGSIIEVEMRRSIFLIKELGYWKGDL